MWPWAHAAVGYILYSLLCRKRETRPAETPVLALGFATQLPDLIDKTFGWVIPVLPGGRSLAHTLIVAVPVVVLVFGYDQRVAAGGIGLPFGIGYLSHVLGDGLATVVTEGVANTSFLLWPLLALPTWETAPSVSAHLSAIALTPWFVFELGLTAVGILLWVSDGYIGLHRLRRWASRMVRGTSN